MLFKATEFVAIFHSRPGQVNKAESRTIHLESRWVSGLDGRQCHAAAGSLILCLDILFT